MGSSSSPYLINVLLVLLSIIIPKSLGCYSAIFSFGDSITDTGNLYISSKNSSFHFFFPPYGETHFHRPTGRCSDGRLIIDFIAEFLGLPHVRPYLELKSNVSAQNFKEAVNFAVVGATALDVAFLAAMGDHNDYTNSSLRTQLDWFKEMLPSLCNTSSNCNKLLSSSLFLVGEIGGNDYNDALLAGKSIEQVQTYVPLVIEEISRTIKELIELGAMTLMVPGNFPIGCLPIYLTKFQTSDKRQYDSSTGCLNWLNSLLNITMTSFIRTKSGSKASPQCQHHLCRLLQCCDAFLPFSRPIRIYRGNSRSMLWRGRTIQLQLIGTMWLSGGKCL